jgi:RNA polymerase sigma factor (sigma-70 family)
MTTEMSQQVVAQLVDSHARFLSFLERRVGSRAVAEDILQEAYTRALTRGDTLRSGESAKAWFYRLLRNALIDHYRRRSAEHRALESAASEPEQQSPQADEALMNTVCACMAVLVDTLKPEYAEALRRVDLEDQSLADYAAHNDITSNNASVRLHRAREALYKQLVTSCGTCATHGCLDCHCQR